MIYKSTNLIARSFEESNITYSVTEFDCFSVIETRFGVKNGPVLIAKFVSVDDENTVSIRVNSLFTKVSKEKFALIQKICNDLNQDYSFFKAYLDEDGDVDIAYDLFQGFPDEYLGETVLELFHYMVEIVEEYYPKFILALHDELHGQISKSVELLKYLRDIQSAGSIALDDTVDV